MAKIFATDVHPDSLETASAGLNQLREVLDAPRALRDVGLAEEDIPDAAALALAAIPASNPRPVTAENLEGLLRSAWAGEHIREVEKKEGTA